MITFHSKTPLPWGAASALLSRATGGSKEREETEELGAKKKKKKKRKNRKKSKEGQSACLLLAPAGSVGEGGAMGAEQDSSDEESDVDQAPLRAAERAAEDEGRSARNGDYMNEMLRRVVHATGASVEQVDACLSYMWENGMQYDNEAEVVKEVLRATTSPQPAPAAVPTSETPAAVIVDVLDAVQTLNSWLLGQGQGSSRDERIQMLLKSAALEKVFALLLSDPAQWIGRSEVKGSFASLLSSLLPNSTAVLESLDTILSYSHDTVLQPVIARTLAGIVREHSLSLAFQRVQDSQCNDPSVPTIFSERELALERVHRLLGIGKKCVDSSLSSSFIAELEAAVQSCAVNASTTSSAYSIQVNTDFDVRNKQTLLQELKAQRSALANRLQTLDAEIARIAEEIDDSQQQYQQLGVDAVSSQLEGRGINADSALQHLVSTVRCFHSCVQAVCCEPDGNGESCTADESTVKDTLSLYIGAELQCARFLADRIFSSRHRVEQLSREMAVYGSLSMKSLTSGCERELRTLKSQIDGDVLSLVEIVKTVDVTVGLVEEGALAASGDSLVQLVAVINRSGASIPQRLQKYRAEQEIDYSQLAAAPLSMSAPQTALLAKPVAEDTAATAKPNIRGKGFAGKNGRSAKPRSGNPKGDKAEKNGHRVETLVAISQLERITAGKSVVRSNASQASETCSAAQQDGSRVGPRTTGKISLLDIQREQRMEQLQQIEDEGVSYDDVHPPGKETFGFSPIMANPLRKLDRKLQ